MFNKNGLQRTIPASIKREIRRRSKFGCVVCRNAIYQYEHIVPEFSDSHVHDPENICLLCGHCHYKVTKGILSKGTIQKMYAEVQTSDNIKKPFDQFDLKHDQITVVLGSSVFKNAKSLIVINNEVVLAIEPPEVDSFFPTLSGHFSDCSGNELMKIDRNEWCGPSSAWDMEITGREINIRSSPETVALHLRVTPPHTIEVIELNMRIGSSHIHLKENQLRVGRITPSAEFYVDIERLECIGADIGVSLEENNICLPPKEVTINGGEIEASGAGIKLAVGSGGTTIRGITIEEATKLQTVITTFPLTTGIIGTTKIYPPRI